MAEYLVDLNATQAAIRAGYSPKTAKAQGSRLLTNGDVASAVSAGAQKAVQKLTVTAAMVKERLCLLAFQDVRALYDDKGNLRPVHELPDHVAPMLAGLEVTRTRRRSGEDTDTVEDLHKVKIVDPVRPLEMLAKHFGLLVDKVEHSGTVSVKTKVVFELHQD